MIKTKPIKTTNQSVVQNSGIRRLDFANTPNRSFEPLFHSLLVVLPGFRGDFLMAIAHVNTLMVV
jgi:hypothetical protein